MFEAADISIKLPPMKSGKSQKWAGMLLLCLALTGCATNEMIMQTPAMEPTLPQGSRFAVDDAAFSGKGPERFSLVIFEYQSNTFNEPVQAPAVGTQICYRVIGLPGEKVEITESGVLINGELLRGPARVQYEPAPASERYTRFNTLQLSEDGYFLLGDNSRRAWDSRYWGEVKRDQILGRVVPRTPAGTPN